MASQTTSPRQVFISHASQDADFAHRLADGLKRLGVQVWIAPDSILPGEGWVKAIERGLRESSHVVIVLTPAALESEWVEKETDVAIALERKGRIKILPLDVEACDVPLLLSSYQMVSFRQDYSAGLSQLARILGLSPAPPAPERVRKKRAGQAWNWERFRWPLAVVALLVIGGVTLLGLVMGGVATWLLGGEKPTPIPTTSVPVVVVPLMTETPTATARPPSPTPGVGTPTPTMPPIAPTPTTPPTDTPLPTTPPTDTPVPATLPYGGQPTIVALSGLNVREGPSTLYPAIGSLSTGQAYRITGQNAIGTWWQIVYPPDSDGRGWVASGAQYGTASNVENVPIVEAPPLPTLAVGSTRMREKDGMVMVFVPKGTFEMGDTADAALAECQKYSRDCRREYFTDEEPPHTVTLDAFWIDRTEVTNAHYARCVAAGVCNPPSESSSSTRKSYYGDSQYDEYPVIYVSWDDATTYCKWAGGRLPTEAEWERAARGPDGRIYPWGNDPPDDMLLNYNWHVGDTTKVGSYPKGQSWAGALDMAGNVLEWVNDWYGDYPSGPQVNPSGPASGQWRVLRGGSWSHDPEDVRAAFRSDLHPDYRDDDYGFRCVVAPGG
jgi:formylglycine-generating enzyme required for sulfatase activity